MTNEQIEAIRKRHEDRRFVAHADYSAGESARDDIDALLADLNSALSYIESHHLAARNVSEHAISRAVAEAMRRIVGVVTGWTT